jgi:Neocarzinostatin family
MTRDDEALKAALRRLYEAELHAADPDPAIRPRVRTRFVPGVALVAAVVVGLVGMLILRGAANGPAAASPSLAASPLTTATIGSPEPSPLVEPSPTAWSAVGPDLGGCIVRTAVVRHFGELVAVCQDLANQTVQVLSSSDGRTWTRSEPSGLQPQAAGHLVLLNGLADSNNGMLVLVGAEASGDISSGDAAAWTSTDGLHWTRVEPSAAFRDAKLNAVAATTDGFLAVGDDGFPGPSVQMPGLRGGAVWHSADGRTWARLPGPASFAHQELLGIVATTGRDLVWGVPPFGGGGFWSSSDGQSWAPATASSGGTLGQIGQVLPTASGYVAVGWLTVPGSAGGTVGEIWISADGQTWFPVPIGGNGSTSGFWGVAAAEGNLIAVGEGGAVAASTDGGATWGWLPADLALSGVELPRLESVNGSVVAFGNIASGGTTVGRIWIAESTLGVLGYGPVPALTVLNPRIIVTPATGLHNGETVTVSVTGFDVGGKVWLSECASAGDATDVGCGSGLASQTFLVTDDSRTGSTPFVVQATASDRSVGGAEHICRDQCVLVATVGGGFAFQIAPLSFAP